MKPINHLSRVLCMVSTILLSGFAVSAQVEPPVTRDDRKVSTKPGEKSTPPVDKSGISSDQDRVSDVLQGKGISGEIRWKKNYGLPYNSSNDGRSVHPYPCQVFRVRSTVEVINKLGVRLPKGTAGPVGTITGQDFGTAGTPPEAGNYYVCHFKITDLPLDRQINVAVEVNPDLLPPNYTGFDHSVVLTAPWVGGSEPQPPAGQHRKITGNTGVTLTENKPHARLVFEMVYAP